MRGAFVTRQIMVVRVMAILVSGLASLGASVLVASPWAAAAAYAAEIQRMQGEHELSGEEANFQ
jgi:hypothetical protein